MKMTLEKERAREAEMAARGKRIQAVMDSMGDVVRDNSKEEDLKAEKAYIEQCLEKDEQARLQDINKKNRLRAEHLKLNEALGSQIREKRLREENEARANKSYMNRWVERAEEDNRTKAKMEDARKQKLLANQDYLREQMGNPGGLSGLPVNTSGSQIGSSDVKNKKKYTLGGMMNPEEARMNRALLQEIARVKRGEEPTGLLANASNNPI